MLKGANITYNPVLLFCYKRSDALKCTVEALQNNIGAECTELFIFSDGAKHDEDVEQVAQVREYIKSISGFKRITIYQSEKNKGLANSIIDGVTKILEQFDKAIVLEDDLITTPNFLSFMNNSLMKYENVSNVFSISGYAFNLGFDENNSETYFLNRGWSWGWATWKNRWDKIDWEVTDYKSFKKDSNRKKEFSKGGSDLNKMLRNQMNGKLDSWAIRWFYHQYKINGLTLYPVYSKVYNNGFDSFATHTNGSSKRYVPNLDKKYSEAFSFPISPEVHPYYQKKFQQKMGIASRLRSKLETALLSFISI